MNKNIEEYSNPKIVFKKAKQIFGKDVIIGISKRKDKKYMILNPENNKWVHFGQMGYQDFTKHKDKERMVRFRNRNRRWANADIYTPAFLSFFLLW